MRIAIASLGKDENSEISMQAGRTPFYLVFEDGKVVEVISNPFSIGGGGAGFAVAKMLADKKVELVIAGRFGPNLTATLKERGVDFRERTGKVKDALQSL